MKKLRVWLICALACLLGVLVLVLVVGVIQRFPYIASATGGLLVCAGVAALLKHSLTLRFTPCRVGEKVVERFVRTGMTVHFFCFSDPENSDAEVPDIIFSGVVRKHKGLKEMEFTDLSPKRTVAWIYAYPGAELTAAFLDGTRGLWLTGILERPSGAGREGDGFCLHVHSGRISGRTTEFPV